MPKNFSYDSIVENECEWSVRKKSESVNKKACGNLELQRS